MGFMRGTTLLDPPNSEAERRRWLGGTIDLFAKTFLVGAAKAFQTEILTVGRGGPLPDRSQGGAQGGRIMSVAPEELVAAARDGWLANSNVSVPARDPGGIGTVQELNRVSLPSTESILKWEKDVGIVAALAAGLDPAEKEQVWNIGKDNTLEDVSGYTDILEVGCNGWTS
jgi:hypothetical protein